MRIVLAHDPRNPYLYLYYSQTPSFLQAIILNNMLKRMVISISAGHVHPLPAVLSADIAPRLSEIVTTAGLWYI